jgi:predicted HTH domain antitoxin
MTTVQVDLPAELLKTAKVQIVSQTGRAMVSLEVARLLALELFREGEVSLGRAAELCGAAAGRVYGLCG